MESVKETILKYKLINKGDVIGVAVSGGTDSMALLHVLNNLTEELDFELVAIHVDHQIREDSSSDASFVMDYCKENRIRAYKFRIDVPKIAKEQNKSLETAARDARFGVFESLIKKNIVDKIAIAHHTTDQAETILLHLFRGSGITGARGMEISRDGVFIRPLLETSKEEILKYIFDNKIPYVHDYTNDENTYARNYLRNTIMPLILQKWPNAINALNNFSKSCVEDDDYINSHIILDALIFDDKQVKIPASYFLYANSIVNRIIFKVLEKIQVREDIEKKHIEMIRDLALNSPNGSKINLPNSVMVHKEYDYITITNKYKEPLFLNKEFGTGEFEIPEVGKVIVKRAKKFDKQNVLYIDAKKVPLDAMWRFKENGDMFEKFGGGTKKLKDYLIDKKIPNRLRTYLPILAYANQVLVVAGVEISEKLKLDETTKTVYSIEFISYQK